MDIVHDRGRNQLLSIVEQHPVPEWAGNSDIVADEKTAAALHTNLFAHQDARLFPLVNPGDVWMSAAYFNQNRAKLNEKTAAHVEHRILQAADVHGCKTEVSKLLTYTPPVEKSASDNDANFAAIEYVNGNKKRMYPIYKADDVKLACEHFARNRDAMSVTQASKIATGIAKLAAHYGVAVTPQIEKLAGAGVIDRVALLEEIYYRAKMLPDTAVGVSMAKVAAALIDCPATELEKQAQSILGMLEDFDRAANVRYYDGYARPEDIVFALTAKQASEMLANVIDLNKLTFNVEKLAALPAETYAVLGDDFVEEIKQTDGAVNREKLASILPTLPMPDKKLLEDHLVNLFG